MVQRSRIWHRRGWVWWHVIQMNELSLHYGNVSPSPPIVEALEALACRKAVAFAIDPDIQDVVFKGDSETIFKHLCSDQPSMAAFGHLVGDAGSLAATLRSLQFSHIKRKGNMVADKLAKLAKTLYEPTIWFEDIHRDVAPLVLTEVFCPINEVSRLVSHPKKKKKFTSF